jgi:hypothetical protein
MPDSSSSSLPTPGQIYRVPCLKGYLGSDNVCRGLWAMSEAEHEVQGMSSDFEFRLVTSDPDSLEYPFNGLYQGWFMMKNAPPLKGVTRIDDREMTILFTRENDEICRVSGKGVNKFGSFTLAGTLTPSDNKVTLYREYYNVTPASSLKRRSSFGADADDKQHLKKKAAPNSNKNVEFSNGTGVVTDSSLGVSSGTPREASGRVRKVSSLMKEYEDTAARSALTPKGPKTSEKKAENSTIPPVKVEAAGIERTHRLSLPMKKCAELVRELVKNPASTWFRVPVDYVALNIPNYPSIVTKPMDFQTIQNNIDAGKYDSHDAFAEHVRLIFKNAITFNQSPDHTVHIAARELAGKFEERFSAVCAQLEAAGFPSANTGGATSKPSSTQHSSSKAVMPPPSAAAASSVVPKSKKVSIGNNGKHNEKVSSGGAAISRSNSAASLPGTVHRSQSSGSFAPVSDLVTNQIHDIFRIIGEMQREIEELRAQVRENEITRRLQEVQEAAQHPLTLEEKKALIEAIHKLPMHLMEKILEIIQAALPPGEMDEIPLDSLDTYTMRKLQRFIEVINYAAISVSTCLFRVYVSWGFVD